MLQTCARTLVRPPVQQCGCWGHKRGVNLMDMVDIGGCSITVDIADFSLAPAPSIG
jgi:hypothetical protein